MASPIGHAIAGYTVYRATWNKNREDSKTLLFLCLLMGIAPDFDFFPGILVGQPALYHQGISHSIGFAVISSLILAWLYSFKRGTFLGDWGRFCLSYCSHLLMDFFAPDGRLPFGEPLFWPFDTSHYLGPFQIFRGFHHAGSTSASTTEWLAGIFQPSNLVAIGLELMVFTPLLLFLYWKSRRSW